MRGRKKPQNHTLTTSQIEGNLHASIQENQERLGQILGQSSDFTTRPYPGGTVFYIRTLVDMKRMEETVLEKLAQGFRIELISSAAITRVRDFQKAVQELLNGSVLIFEKGKSEAYAVRLPGGEQRSVDEPQSEAVIRGSRAGFNEDIETNMSLIRRRLKTPSLRVEELVIGEVTQTKVWVVYAEGIVEPAILAEVRNRLNDIEIDAVLESNYLEEFIEESPFSLFPTVQNTERPDVVCGAVLEGKVGILVDGTPFALVVPLTFWGAMQASEDYYSHFAIATAIRWVRFIFIFIALFFPSIYVAITTFHQEMLPTNLLLSVAAAREGAPFPALVEALAMEVTFEALREAGVRLPRQVGQAVSIVGALVIGQAAVEAGIVSAPMVIVVATTGIASFTIPRYNFGFAMRLLRFPIIILAGTLGLFGIVFAVMALLIHLSALRSFGVPYLSPVSPFSTEGIKDVFIRAPFWNYNKRPRQLGGKENSIRVPKGQKPKPTLPDQSADGKGGGNHGDE